MSILVLKLLGFEVESVPPKSKFPDTESKFPTVESKSVTVSKTIEVIPELSVKATSPSKVPAVMSSVNVCMSL